MMIDKKEAGSVWLCYAQRTAPLEVSESRDSKCHFRLEKGIGVPDTLAL